MKMRSFLLSLAFGLLLLSPGEVRGTADLDDLEVLAGEWKETGEVKKLFDTPLGAVYKFGLSDRHSVQAQAFRTSTGGIEYREPHEKKCNCNRCKAERKGIKGLLQINFGGRKVKLKRFVVLDFKLRAYPALDAQSTAGFRFQYVRLRD